MTFDKYKTRGAYHYQWYKDNTFDYRDCVDKCVKFCKGSTLDVGCGDGVVMNELESKGLEVSGIDNDETAIKLCHDRCFNAYLHDINAPLVTGQWDYMVCLNVIEHLDWPDRIRQVFNRNITKAAIIITDIPGKETDPYHVHEFTPYELKQMFHTRKVKAFQIGKDFHGIEVFKS